MNENQVQIKKPQSMREWLESYSSKFLEAIPKNTIDVGRFITAASLEIQANPKLQKCDKVSIFQSLLESARYGLEVGKLLGQAWLIPYNDNKYMPDGSKVKVMTCHFQLGYKGLLMLARRSQTIKTVTAEVVDENDLFEVELGQGRHLTHKIDIRKERGEPIAYYCLVELESGVQFAVMTKKDAENHRDHYSKAYSQKYEGQESTWDTNFDEMALKTCVIKVLKLCPISIEALVAAGKVEREEEDKNVTPAVEALPPPPDVGEIEITGQEVIEAPPEEKPAKQTTAQKAIAAAKRVGEPSKDEFLRGIAKMKKGAADFPASRPEPTNTRTVSGLDIF